MSLKNILKFPDETTVSPAFFQVMVDHFPWFKENQKFTAVEVSSKDADVYKGDFHGLLEEMKVPSSYFRIVTAFNGLKSPMDYDGTMPVVKIPSFQEIQRLLSVFDIEM